MRALAFVFVIFSLASCGRQRPADKTNPKNKTEVPSPPVMTGSVPDTCYYAARSHFHGDDLPADEQLRERAKANVWRNPIGEMLERYMFQSGEAKKVPLLAHQISERIFAEPNKIQERVDAIRLMVEDLYDCRMMTPELMARVEMLHLEIERGRVNLERRLRGSQLSFTSVLPYFIGVAVLVGSDELHLQLWGVAGRIYNRIRQWLSLPMAEANLPELSLSRLFGRRFFQNYRLGRSYMAFSHLVMGYMILDMLSREHNRTARREVYELSGESLLALLSVSGL